MMDLSIPQVRVMVCPCCPSPLEEVAIEEVREKEICPNCGAWRLLGWAVESLEKPKGLLSFFRKPKRKLTLHQHSRFLLAQANMFKTIEREFL